MLKSGKLEREDLDEKPKYTCFEVECGKIVNLDMYDMHVTKNKSITRDTILHICE